ncbi:MAG: sulfotransferase [Chitinophagales bacterium]|nr:sulfotransferase [Chitinophagales bacterium]
MKQYHKEILKSNIRKGRLLKYMLREFKAVTTSLPSQKKWIFVLGCYNSGTTLLHKLLASSSEIASLPGEGQFLTNQFLVPSHVGLSRLWIKEMDKFYLEASNTGPNASKIKKQWASYMNHPARNFYMEKSPTDIARIKWFEKHFDKPYFVGIVRNGFAVAEGIRRKASYPIDEAIMQWKKSNEIMFNDLESVQNKIMISYEELTSDANGTMNKVFDFLSLPEVSYQESSEMDIHGVKSGIENMNHLSFNNISEEDIAVIEKHAGDLLTKLKYSRD